jgi:hypothetical protein
MPRLYVQLGDKPKEDSLIRVYGVRRVTNGNYNGYPFAPGTICQANYYEDIVHEGDTSTQILKEYRK